MIEKNVEICAQVLSEWGSAIRGDWSEIDGRQCRAELDYIVDALKSDEEVSIETLRLHANVCFKGHGYWENDCDRCEGEK